MIQLLFNPLAMAPHSSKAWRNPRDGGAWWAAVHVVARSRTRLSDFTFTFHFHALEKEMATHSSVLAWRIPGTGEPAGLPSLGSHRVGHDWSDSAAVGVYVNSADIYFMPQFFFVLLAFSNFVSYQFLVQVLKLPSISWADQRASNVPFLYLKLITTSVTCFQ